VYIKELWRYPVKSMAGERLTQVRMGELGFEGDRKVLVRGGNGRLLTSRTHHQLLGLRGTLGPDGQALIFRASVEFRRSAGARSERRRAER